jgi:hypothetical protein
MYDVLNKLMLLSSEHYPSLLLSIQQQPVICSLAWSRTTSHSSVRTNFVFFYSTFWIRTIGSRPCENSLKVQIAIPMTARRNRSSLSMHTIELDSSPKAKIFYNFITPMLHKNHNWAQQDADSRPSAHGASNSTTWLSAASIPRLWLMCWSLFVKVHSKIRTWLHTSMYPE